MNPNKLPKNQENPQPSDSDTAERTVSLLQKIQAGAVGSKCIGPAERRLIVSHLMADGYSTADMAQILKVSDRSIERDKKAIRQTNALAARAELVEQMVGRLVSEAELSVQRIRKITRDKNTSQAVKVDAEHRCYQIISDMIASMRHLGYLPTATSKLQADFTHNIGQIPDFSQMQAEVQRLRQITGETQGADPQLTEQLNQIETELEKVKLVNQIEKMSNTVKSKEIQNESDQ
ncbi:MAG: helix-turn-helix transcriptional regulator [Phycisphaerae bacterium]